MLKFYFNGSPNPTKVALFLEEAGLAYEPIAIDTRKGDQFKPEFAAINPNAKVPVIVDGDATVFDSNAILLYLAEKTGQFLPGTALKARGEMLSWLMFVASGIGPYSGQAVHFRTYAPKPNDYSLSRYKTELLRLYDLLNKRLGETKYLGGDEYSIADMATFPWTRQHQAQGAKIEALPNFRRWFDDVSARPAVKAMIAKQGEIKSSRETATDEHKDRFFGRGKYARA